VKHQAFLDAICEGNTDWLLSNLASVYSRGASMPKTQGHFNLKREA
jgi:hypothetical protein